MSAVSPSDFVSEPLNSVSRSLRETFGLDDGVSVEHLSAVAVIDEVVVLTGLSLCTVLKSAGVRPHSYRRWRDRPSVRRGSVAGAGRLWDLTQCINDLVDLLPSLAAWLAESSHQKMLRTGQFDALVDLAAADVRPVSQPLPDCCWYTGDDSILGTLTEPLAPVTLLKATRVDASSFLPEWGIRPDDGFDLPGSSSLLPRWHGQESDLSADR